MAVGAIVLWPRDDEPRYQGKTLSQWIDSYAVNVNAFRSFSEDELNQPAPQAVRAIGTNALPYFLAWIQYEPSPSKPKEFLVRLLLKLRLPVSRDSAEVRADRASTGFTLLGDIAGPAIPELSKLAGATNGSVAPRNATFALVGIGPIALPALEAVIRNTNAVARLDAVLDLNYGLRKFGPDAYPILLECLDDSNPDVATTAANALAEVGVESAIVCAKITRHFRHPDWLRRLRALQIVGRYRGQAREQARVLVPDLLATLADTNSIVQQEAERILRRIAPEVLTNAPSR